MGDTTDKLYPDSLYSPVNKLLSDDEADEQGK